MGDLINQCRDILSAVPVSAWGPMGNVTAAIIAVFGVWLSLRGQRAASRRQREFELRREQLLSMAEKAAIPSQMFATISEGDTPISKVSALLTPTFGDLSKSSCVASLATMTKAFDASRCFVFWWLEVLKARLKFDWVQGQIELNNSAVERWNNRITRELEAIREQPQRKPLIDSLMRERDQSLELSGKLLEQKTRAHFQLARKAGEAAMTYAPILRELQIAIRKELDLASRREIGMEIDADCYRKIFDETNLANTKAAAEFFVWIECFSKKLTAGEDPFVEEGQ